MSYKINHRIIQSHVLPGMANDWLDDTGERILNMAQALVPVDTGYLRSSGYYKQTGVYTAEVGFDADYAGYVEYGTRYMRAQPYLRPAVLLA